ncbi:MAG: AmmeMemoRadiSam system protein B [Acidobacteriota bacterium]
MNRKPAVSGMFYPSTPAELREMIEEFVDRKAAKEKAIAIISPHAGYIYSGKVAGRIFSSVELPENFIILCPNHTGRGARASIMDYGTWETPLGKVKINSDLALLLKDNSPTLEADSDAHIREHSLEVQLPFLQHLLDDFSFVPICLSTQSYRELTDIGEGIASSVREYEKPVLIIVSSDMTHYEDANSAREKDMKAIRMIEEINPRGLYDTVRSEGITMCGYAPAVSALEACCQLKAKRGKLVIYTTSGDTTGDYSSVVAYAGVLIA